MPFKGFWCKRDGEAGACLELALSAGDSLGVRERSSLKIAVAGKGGSGKTLVASTLSRLLARTGFDVLAVDVDTTLNLAAALGIPEELRRTIVPLVENREIIEERAALRGGAFRLNPQVNDLVDKIAVTGPDRVKLMVVGTVRDAGSGCMCPANALIRGLLQHLVLGERVAVVMDMEAGLEHLGRSTIRGFDALLIVTEPSVKSVEVSLKIAELAGKLAVRNTWLIGNKVESAEDERFLVDELSAHSLTPKALIPYDRSIMEADRNGVPPLDFSPSSPAIEALLLLSRKITDAAQT